MLKAIETVYNGYRFRSRLEARWAVFFDALGVKYEYEKEGFDLGEAGWYLPDFWLPNEQIWVEIKGQEPTHDEKMKCGKLADDSGFPVTVFAGDAGYHLAELLPNYIGYLVATPLYSVNIFYGYHAPPEALSSMDRYLFDTDFCHESGLAEFLAERGFKPPPADGTRENVMKMIDCDRDYFLEAYEKPHPRWIYGIFDHDRSILYEDGRLRFDLDHGYVSNLVAEALLKARQARFEHGESGAQRRCA